MRAKQIAYGLATSLPGLGAIAIRLRRRARGGEGGGAGSARYCYSVWLRHLVKAAGNGLDAQPASVVEFGPGDSLGIGLAALLSGSEKFCAVDVVPFADPARNLRIFDELTELFRRREPIPDHREFPEITPRLATHDFPYHLLPDARLRDALSPGRVQHIRDSILKADEIAGNGPIAYKTPWHDAAIIEKQSVDLIYSQAVMEHIDDLPHAYQTMARWLKPGGYLSHAIDFRSHNLARGWNGHLAYSDFTWRLIRGRRPYLINRQPLSTHLKLLQAQGFQLREQTPETAPPDIPRHRLASAFRELSDADLTTAVAFIQAQKA